MSLEYKFEIVTIIHLDIRMELKANYKTRTFWIYVIRIKIFNWDNWIELTKSNQSNVISKYELFESMSFEHQS